MFDYEKLLYDSLLIQDFSNPLQNNFKDKHLWVKKATGLGVTEFFLRFMAWLCFRNDDYRNSQMCIVTGPNQDIAIKLIKRMKGLFEQKLGVTFSKKSIGIDPGFGSSKFAIVITQFQNGIIQVIYAEEFERPNFRVMIEKIL